MQAMRNLVHGAVLCCWALLGLLFTVKVLFGGASAFVPALFTAGSFWLWFAGLAAVTTWSVLQLKSAVGALAVHALAFLVLVALPLSAPFSFFRLGLDLLTRA